MITYFLTTATATAFGWFGMDTRKWQRLKSAGFESYLKVIKSRQNTRDQVSEKMFKTPIRSDRRLPVNI